MWKSSLFDAIERDDVSLMQRLLTQTPALAQSVKDNDDKDSPLIVAAASGSIKCLQALLALGSQCNGNLQTINDSQETALMHAVVSGNIEAVKLLLPVSEVDAEKDNGFSALAVALNGHKPEIVRLLLDAGANPNQTAVVRAAFKTDKDSLNLLMSVTRGQPGGWSVKEKGVSAFAYAVGKEAWAFADVASEMVGLEEAHRLLGESPGNSAPLAQMPRLCARLEREALAAEIGGGVLSLGDFKQASSSEATPVAQQAHPKPRAHRL